MPSYIYDLDIPAGTTAETPAEVVADLPAGKLTGLTVFFPPGPQGEVGVRVLHNRHTICPSQDGQWLAWDSGAVFIPMAHWLLQNEQQLVMQGQAPQANFAHRIMFKIDVDVAAQTTATSPTVYDLDRVQPAQEG